MPLRPLVGSFLASALLVLAFHPSPAFAHTPPERTAPEADAVLDRPPATVEIWFVADLDASEPAELTVIHNPSGQRVDQGGDEPLDPGDPSHMRVTLQPNPAPGRYVVSWEATGIDTHPTMGSYSFTVAGPPGSDDDDRVVVMLSVFGAAVFALSVAALGYLLRRLLGLVPPPPEQPPSEHH
jgi:methionine-rich copper-binding protein CopC